MRGPNGADLPAATAMTSCGTAWRYRRERIIFGVGAANRDRRCHRRDRSKATDGLQYLPLDSVAYCLGGTSRRPSSNRVARVAPAARLSSPATVSDVRIGDRHQLLRGPHKLPVRFD